MKSLVLAVTAVALAIPFSNASASTFTAAFPSTSSIGVDDGPSTGQTTYCCFFVSGDSLTQNYTGTGLASVGELSFSIPVTSYLNSGSAVDFNVLLNGTLIGTTSWSSIAAGTDSFDASFSPIASIADGFTVELLETNTIPNGEGSVALSEGSLTLTSAAAAATPEPSSMGLLATSLVSLGYIRRQRRTA